MRVHISLKVTSITRSLGFYSALFGRDASQLKDGYANFRLDEPPIHLALVERSDAGGGGVSHLGFEVPAEGNLLFEASAAQDGANNMGALGQEQAQWKLAAHA